ncbi:MAG: hypothetical protein A2V70_19145 [Planctomycetes bacterium RBG_13_63_9]|nr:MAG: hypothetical protein A2V70_19145 [Planctomycetes bacterium RBG_13_63_9]
MTLRELDSHGREMGLDFTKHHNRAERGRRILAAYADGELRTDTSVTSSPLDTAAPGERKLDFEALLTHASESADRDTTSPQWGGVRPGSGRPEGLTNEMAAYNRLSSQPHPAIKLAIESIFDAWAARAQCPSVALTKEEAFDLALPWTHAAELTGLANRIPPWLTVVLACVWSTALIVKAKAKLAREAAAARKVARESPAA